MNLTESWNHAVELELQGRQEAQTLPGWAVDGVLSSMPRCPPGSLRSVQLPLDHLVEMRDRAVCHQQRNGRRSHVPVWWDPVMYCMWRRGGVQEPSPGEPQWPIDVLWIPPRPRPPWKTDQWDRIQNQRSGIPVISSDERVDRRIWWLTVSKAADKSSRMRTDDLESAFAIRRASVTASSAVSVEWPLLKPDCLASSLLFCLLWKKQWDLVEDNSFECFGNEWKERDRSVVFYKRSV